MADSAKKQFKALFNETLREISEEVSEFIDNDPNDPTAGKRMVTKAEALCRYLFKMALGYREKVKGKNDEAVEVVHLPNKWAMKEVMDRVEGRTTAAPVTDDKSVSIADRMRENSKKIANQLAEKNASHDDA